jgi:hypothetical protein
LVFLSGQVTKLFSPQICHHNSGSYSSQINMVDCIFLNTKKILFFVLFIDPSWSANTCGGEYKQEMTLCIVVPKQKRSSSNSFSVSYRLYVCRDHSECSVRDLHFLVTVVYTEDAPTRVIHYLSHVVGLH